MTVPETHLENRELQKAAFVLAHTGIVGEAPVRFFERVAEFPELPWTSAINIFDALGFPTDRHEAIIKSMRADFPDQVGDAFLKETHVVVSAPMAMLILQVAIITGTKFNSEAWTKLYGDVGRAAFSKMAAKAPPERRGEFVAAANINTLGSWHEATT